MDLRYLKRALIGVILSVLCAGIAYFLWMAAFLLSSHFTLPVARGLFWVVAPVATAIGFAAGIVIHERVARVRRTGFLRVLAWPLVGCIVGAIAVYWRGPMLIVFGMVMVGTISVVSRELVLRVRSNTRIKQSRTRS